MTFDTETTQNSLNIKHILYQLQEVLYQHVNKTMQYFKYWFHIRSAVPEADIKGRDK